MNSKYPQVGDAFRSGKAVKDVEADLKRGIEEYKKTVTPAAPAGITKADL
jgi:hypothetical protein